VGESHRRGVLHFGDDFWDKESSEILIFPDLGETIGSSDLSTQIEETRGSEGEKLFLETVSLFAWFFLEF